MKEYLEKNMIIGGSLLLVSFLFLSSLKAQTFTFPDDGDFYNPEVNAFRMTISQPTELEDQSKHLQKAIDEVSANGGGILTIEGTADNNVYNIVKGAHIKSNVHIRVNPDVVFMSNNPLRANLFSAGKTGNQRVKNISISCTDPDKYFLFDFSNRTPGKRDGGAVAVSVGGVDNFYVGNFRVKDNNTPYSCITVNLLDYQDEKGKTRYMFARNGIIEDVVATNTHYGYGVVQCQAAFNVLYRKLDGEGGATLRLETGAIGKANKADRSVFIDKVYGKDIKCKNGQAALTLSPHTVNNGQIFVDDLLAVSCEAGAIVAAGFLSGKKGQRDEEGNAIDGYVYGYFDSSSVVSDLKVIYGTAAQLRPIRRSFVPCNQKHLIASERNPDEESYKGPTVAAIVYYAKAGTDRDHGYYTVHTPGLIMEGFPESDGVRENKEYVVSPAKDGYNDCDK